MRTSALKLLTPVRFLARALALPRSRAFLLLVALAAAFVGAVLVAQAVLAQGAPAAPTPTPPASVDTVLASLTTWCTGILAALATLFLTVGGIRYLMAAGDMRRLEEAKQSIRSALIGYALAALAPLIFGIVQRAVGS